MTHLRELQLKSALNGSSFSVNMKYVPIAKETSSNNLMQTLIAWNRLFVGFQMLQMMILLYKDIKINSPNKEASMYLIHG